MKKSILKISLIKIFSIITILIITFIPLNITHNKKFSFMQVNDITTNIKIKSVFTDTNNNSFCATYSNGIYVKLNDENKFRNIPLYIDNNKKIPVKNISDINEQNNQLLISTLYQGAISINLSNWSITRIAMEDIATNTLVYDYQVSNIIVDQHNNIWMGNNSGIYKLNNSQIFTQYINGIPTDKNKDCNKILLDKNNNLWMLTIGQGIFLKPNNSDTFHNIEFFTPNNYIYDVKINNNITYLATFNKLYKSKDNINFYEDNTCKINNILTINDIFNHDLILGTHSHGLWTNYKNDNFYQLKFLDNIDEINNINKINNNSFYICTSKHGLWIMNLNY